MASYSLFKHRYSLKFEQRNNDCFISNMCEWGFVKSRGKCWDTRPDTTAVSSPLESLWLIGKLLPQVKIKMLSSECIEALCICIWGMEQKWSRNFWQLIFSSGNTSRRLKYALYFSSSKSEYIRVVQSTGVSLSMYQKLPQKEKHHLFDFVFLPICPASLLFFSVICPYVTRFGKRCHLFLDYLKSLTWPWLPWHKWRHCVKYNTNSDILFECCQ